jgi:DNA-binding SARP family transcriptional activator/tetratricopeptide (TPR) repeat protein
MLPFVQLLGVPKINLGSSEIIFLSDKRFLLLAYLAFKADWVSREALSVLFFENSDSASARKNLRHLLSRVRALDFVVLESSGEQVRWLVQSDMAEFQLLISSNRFLEALELYSGGFLSGLHSDVPELSDWLDSEREGLHNAFRDAALLAAKNLVAKADFEAAQTICLRVLSFDSLAEDVLQVLLGCAVHTNGRLEALRAFESFQKLLKIELNLAPLETTVQLASALNQKSFEPPLEKSVLQNFPLQASAFVGRDVDLSEISQLFVQPEVRLLTLVGAGGMGKSRLAIQVATEQAPNFVDGALFVPLAGVDELVPAILAAFNLPAQSQENQVVFLKNFLSEKHLLLVLDNLEHLLNESAVILELLAAAPKLRILTTSREALNLQAEYLVDVLGLDVPKADSEQIELFDSVQLLLRSAKRVNPRFVITLKDKPFVTEICALLQGSPLAIELASHWLRVLSLEEVVQEIRLGLDFLSANQPDVPLRHRSMRAVFDASWQFLTVEQQLVLAKLSLLRGGFTLESLSRVAKAGASILFGLVSKSLVTRSNNRFLIHEVIRQFSEQKLEPVQKEAALLELGLLAQDWAVAVATHDPAKPVSETVKQFEQEFENISLALEWSVKTNPFVCAKIVYSTLYFWIAAARKPLGMQWLNQLLELPELQARDSTRANLLSIRSVLGMRLHNTDVRLADAEAALEIALEISDLSAQARALNAISEVSGDIGNFDRATSCIKAALEILENVPNANVQIDCLNSLAFLYWQQGETTLAIQTFENLISKSRANKNLRGLANGLANFAYVYITQNDLEKAQNLLEQAILIYREVKNMANLCATLLTLCNVMFRRGNRLGVVALLQELGVLCSQVQDAACFTCFYALNAAVMQQQQRHAKGLRLNAIANTWRFLPGQDFNLDDLEPNQFIEAQSSQFFSTEQLQLFTAQAKSLSPKEAMQYALGTLELFEDSPELIPY